jgi:hypothetical protein
MMGLAISAAAPNQNVALLLVIVVLVPQFLFAGALLPLSIIPGGEVISSIASTRWAFEALVNSSGMGQDLMDDPCWKWTDEEKKQPSDLTEEQKQALGCKCMGVQMFTDCSFPGIRNEDFYTADARVALAAAKPVEPAQPTAYPSPTPYPTLTPWPTYTPLPTFTPLPKPQTQDQGVLQKYEDDSKAQGEAYRKKMVDQGSAYQKVREQQGDVYTKQRTDQGDQYEKQRKAQGDEYRDAMQKYGDEREAWQTNRQKAISSAENKIDAVMDNFGRTFKGSVGSRWFAMSVIMLVVFGLVIFFQKRKDVV